MIKGLRMPYFSLSLSSFPLNSIRSKTATSFSGRRSSEEARDPYRTLLAKMALLVWVPHL